jgi:enoyl-CoA hydratase
MKSFDLPPELTVTVEDGGIARLTLNRPDALNAVNADMHRGLARVWDQLADVDGLRVVVVTGAGKAFSAGGDLKWFTRVAEDSALRSKLMAEGRRIVTAMTDFPFPIIAAVNGAAVGLGCSLAVLADIVLMAENAFFADPHVSIGLVAGDGGALSWPTVMSLSLAKEYLFTGDRIDAAAAYRIGMANHIHPRDVLAQEATKLAQRLAAQPPQALQDTKRILNSHLRRAVVGALDFAFAAESESFAQPDFVNRLQGLS